MADLSVSLVQYNISWCNKLNNFNYLREKLQKVASDLVILPEMFQTGFVVDEKEMAESMDGETIRFLKSISLENNTAICGSFLCKENQIFTNRFVLVQGGEVAAFYDKVHLFALGKENSFISSGHTKVDIVVNGFKLRPIICYDLRFPYLSYNDSEYDALICVANWPSQRIQHWDALLQARAIENQAYVIACNRIGEHSGIYYPGHSSAYMPNGDRLVHSHKEEIVHFTISNEILTETRSALPFLRDRKM